MFDLTEGLDPSRATGRGHRSNPRREHRARARHHLAAGVTVTPGRPGRFGPRRRAAGGRRSREKWCINRALASRWTSITRAHFRADVDARRTSIPRRARRAGRQGGRLADRRTSARRCSDSTRQLTDDERMRHHASFVEQLFELPIGPAEVIDPDRRIHQQRDYLDGRRRRGAAARRSEPPSAASRLALSRATSARSPSCTTAVFSRIPLSACARAINSASRTRVVRIHMSMHHRCAYGEVRRAVARYDRPCTCRP